MDYKNGKIYKVQFDDGHFYIGSTAGELRRRLFQHRINKTDKASICSKHIQKVGKNTCRIVLIEDYPCDSKEHLRRKEDEHIQAHRNDPMCLNIARAFLTDEDRAEYQRNYFKIHAERKKEVRAKRKASQVKPPLVGGEVSGDGCAVTP